MDKKNLKHDDCLHFAPVDVVKGLCRVHNKMVFIDTDVCGKFEMLPKCKNCACFGNVKEDFTGECTGFKDNYWTYTDLRATTCEGYKAK